MSDPEYRFDPLYRRHVIIAQHRSQRPNEFSSAGSLRRATRCPFCLGHEEDTPPASAEYRLNADSNPWDVRVVPNKYPAVVAPDPGVPDSRGAWARGVHEVIIESPDHLTSLSQVTPARRELALRAYRDRLAAAGNQPGVVCGVVFKNVGPAAGASIEHTHSQLLALNAIPAGIESRCRHELAHWKSSHHCLLCHLLDRELHDARRIVVESKDFVSYCPYASRFPGETWIVPKTHSFDFRTCGDEQLNELARLLGQLVVGLEKLYPGLAYNLTIQTAPFDETSFDQPLAPASHWHLLILPRLAHFAGFEWSSECFINPERPEHVAEQLRELDLG